MDAGIQIEPQFGFSFEEIVTIARDAESLGFSHFWTSDHLFLRPEEPETECLEAWSLLAALSQVTTRLRLGTLVTCQSYRSPALLAKIAAGVDVMSGGRLEFGIGAGWKEVEYTAYGYAFPPIGVRVEQLIDTLEIVRALWTTERANHAGRHYSVHDAPSAPKPLQKPHPPILVGAAGERMLRVVARYANAVNIRGWFLSPGSYATAMDRLRKACAREGRPFDAIRKTHGSYAIVARTRAQVDAIAATVSAEWAGSAQEREDRLREAIVGTPPEVREQVRAYQELGVSQVMFLFPYGREREMLQLIGEEVLPRLQ
ncbi:MAG TPA: TIGR03560 family F420-dependent LLM class oxidoreductase [bacterium]|jgi:F420-dependent oxidoreductase-like protein|nr:TIGR03560 family F420-dependent LLM class oxidoreductase [bacterium]